MDSIDFVDSNDINYKDEDDETKTVYIRVSDAVNLLWDKNPKLHDVQALTESVLKYGFQIPPKYDSTLRAIKAGNGRIIVLNSMERNQMEPPRGIGILKDGSWVMPLTIGVNAEDELDAAAFAVDDNNLSLSGGDLTPRDAARMYDPGDYKGLLEYLALSGNVPVSIGDEGLNVLFESIQQDKETQEEREERKQKGGIECPNCGYII